MSILSWHTLAEDEKRVLKSLKQGKLLKRKGINFFLVDPLHPEMNRPAIQKMIHAFIETGLVEAVGGLQDHYSLSEKGEKLFGSPVSV